MDNEEKAPFFIRLLGVAFFFIIAASSLTWFVYSVVDLTAALYNKPPVIAFDKSSMYSLGGSITMFFIFITGWLQGVLEKDLTKKSEKFLTRGMIAGVVIMFILPQVVHYTVSELIPEDRYKICEEMSYQWMMHKTFVYTDNQTTCDNLIKEKEIQISQPWF